MSTPAGLRRNYLSILHFGHTEYTVEQGSDAADAIRQTPQYKDAYKEAVAWQKAVETAEAKAAGRPPRTDAVCEPSCDEFALNAVANGWLVGEKIAASSDNYTPQVADNQRRHLGGQPLDVHALAAEEYGPQPASPAGAPWRRAQQAAAMDEHEPALSRGLEHA